MMDDIKNPADAATSAGPNNSNSDDDRIPPNGGNANTLLDTALFYRRQGLSVIPIKPNSKEPIGRWKE